MLGVHRLLGTWAKAVDRYVVLSSFARDKFIQAGLPASKMIVKPNFLEAEPGLGAHSGGHASFVGRLTEEKGIATLLEAWTRFSDIALVIAGQGPMQPQIQQYVQQHTPGNLRYAGHVSREEVSRLIKDSSFLIFPSRWYEGFPMTIAEAFACGTPVIASRLGAMAEIVDDGRTGLHFTPGDADDLARKVEWAWAHPNEIRDMGRNARTEYEAKYTAERNYKMLLEVYQQVMQEARQPLTVPRCKVSRVAN
jgi:glycosyltransferase involved in cell wall biosynthesis